VHLIGFIIRIYYDARSPESQNQPLVISLRFFLNVCYSPVLICVCSVRAGDGVRPALPGVPRHVLVPKATEYQQTDAKISTTGEEEPKSQR